MLHRDQILLSPLLQLLIVSHTFKSPILNASKALLSPTASGLVPLHAPFRCSFQLLALLPLPLSIISPFILCQSLFLKHPLTFKATISSK